MKKLLPWVLTVAVLAGIAAIVTDTPSSRWQDASNTASNSNNAAFRDGMYTGKLAAQRGERPHAAIGRWARPAERNSFAAGYERGYNQNLAPSPEDRISKLTDAAFRDGLYLGKLNASQGRELHIASGRWSRPEDRSSFTAGYQQAYDETLLAMR